MTKSQKSTKSKVSLGVEITPEIQLAIQKAASKYKNVRAFADDIGISYQAVYYYLNGTTKKIPPNNWGIIKTLMRGENEVNYYNSIMVRILSGMVGDEDLERAKMITNQLMSELQLLGVNKLDSSIPS